MSTLAHFTVGEGSRSTVLLHGFLGSGKNLRAVAQRWAARDPQRRFLLPDLTGHGESPPLGPTARLDDMAADVLATAESAGFTAPLTAVGHSLGGRVALAMARLAPERLSDVVLLDIAPGLLEGARSESRRVLDIMMQAPERLPDRRAYREFFLGKGLSPGLSDWILMNVRPEEVDGRTQYGWRIDLRALDRLHARFTEEDLWPVVEAGAVPVRCLRGGRSRYVTDEDVARFQQLGCPVQTFADAGHYLHVDALDAVVDSLTS